jgi:hypothetical protein
MANYKGLDRAICGDCKHRIFRSCYVNIRHGPAHVWNAWKRGVYRSVQCWEPELDHLMAGRYVRIGSYGDPAAVPIAVWNGLLRAAAGSTSYTHQWRTCPQKYQDICMASCETPKEAADAIAKGWRVFYARQEDEKLPAGFFVCPASAEAGKKTDCQHCQSCRGGVNDGKRMPCIKMHGTCWKRVFYRRGTKLVAQHRKIHGVFWQVSGKVAAKRTVIGKEVA